MSANAALKEGLTTQQAQAGLQKYGQNEIYKPWGVTFWGIFAEEIVEPMMVLLVITGVLYASLGNLGDAVTIFVVIFLLVMSEVWTEFRAKDAISALQKIAAVKTWVRRNSQVVEINTLEVVPEDVVILTQGTKISADAWVQQSIGLQVDEAALTGESFPVEKNVGDTIFAGTYVTSGEGEAVVAATGKDSRLGKIAAQTKALKPPKTALQLAMKALAGQLVYIAAFFAIAIPLLAYARGGQDWKIMIMTGLALAFAVIPEELPIVITMVLGLGSYRLSNNSFLIKQLKTAEALGNATTVVTDKTGTITEGKLQVVAVYPPSTDAVFRAAFLCTFEHSMDPLDTAVKARAKGLGLIAAVPELVRERSFGDGKKTKAVMRKAGDSVEFYMSGAPEEIFAACQNIPAEARMALETQTKAGRRVIGVAHKPLSQAESGLKFDQLEQNLTFAGLIAFEDSPRAGVKETIARFTEAGVRTIMVTGDHPLTASYIASRVGIRTSKVVTGDELDQLSDEALRKTVQEVSVFARSTPEHKLRIVQALQDNHEVVAVTGDGINDVLALKKADIGIAMGQKGTDVAREAASVVLADDNFNTIAMGIFEGRGFFDNLQKGIKYYLSIKLALILIFLLPVLLGIRMPFAPIQIIILELFMDLAASAGFVAEPKEKNIYTRKPRDPRVPIFTSRNIIDMAIKSLVLFAAVTGIYLYFTYTGSTTAEAQTYAFAAWITGHIVLAFISRSDKVAIITIGVFKNNVMMLWAFAAIAFLFCSIYIPYVNNLVRLTPVALPVLLLSMVVVIAVLMLLEVRKLFLKAN
jgi:Ca2+-transporting ATPase